jgi:hypothetical protein
MKKCEGCGESFCVECKELEYCFMCNSNFCKEHNRMVDCKSWKLRHCRPCGHDRKRCSLCGVPCFEDCVCDKDEKLPTAKRAKLSWAKWLTSWLGCLSAHRCMHVVRWLPTTMYFVGL